MGKEIKQLQEVEVFLEKVKGLISNKQTTVINNRPWADGRVNKTLSYMAETGIKLSDIRKVIEELDVCNYSYTADDRNERYPNEQVWIFGITKCLIDKDEDLYVKLKIRKIRDEFLLIMSFHPECPGTEDLKLSFPYHNKKINRE